MEQLSAVGRSHLPLFGSICPGMDGIRAMQEQLPREARLLQRKISEKSENLQFQFFKSAVEFFFSIKLSFFTVVESLPVFYKYAKGNKSALPALRRIGKEPSI